MTAPALTAGPDLHLSPTEYRTVAELLYGHSGIRLREGKEALVISRLGHRVRALRLPSLSAYVAAIAKQELPGEFAHFIDVLTTNKTGFFREDAHFDFLIEEVFPRFAAEGREVKIWSAACSSGEEPYTLAMVVREHLPSSVRVRILATDISHRILASAQAARYTAAQAEGIPAPYRQQYWTRLPDGGIEAKPELTSLVRFAHLNLTEAWPMKGPFDVIFCRNVMIYFDRDLQSKLVQRFGALLAPGGILAVGHAESLTGITHGLEQLQPAVYRRAGGGW